MVELLVEKAEIICRINKIQIDPDLEESGGIQNEGEGQGNGDGIEGQGGVKTN